MDLRRESQCDLFFQPNPDIAGTGVLVAFFFQTVLTLVTWGSIKNSTQNVLRTTLVAIVVIQLSGVLAFLRHQLSYYHSAIIAQLAVLSLVPLGCILLRPGCQNFTRPLRITIAIVLVSVLIWPLYLLITRTAAQTLEFECRAKSLDLICESGDIAFSNQTNCASLLNSVLPVVPSLSLKTKLDEPTLRVLALSSGDVVNFYNFQIYVNVLTLFTLVVVLPGLAFVGLNTSRPGYRILVFAGMIGWPIFGLCAPVVHQLNTWNHFQIYAGDDEGQVNYGQAAALIALLYPVLELISAGNQDNRLGLRLQEYLLSVASDGQLVAQIVGILWGVFLVTAMLYLSPGIYSILSIFFGVRLESFGGTVNPDLNVSEVGEAWLHDLAPGTKDANYLTIVCSTIVWIVCLVVIAFLLTVAVAFLLYMAVETLKHRRGRDLEAAVTSGGGRERRGVKCALGVQETCEVR